MKSLFFFYKGNFKKQICALLIFLLASSLFSFFITSTKFSLKNLFSFVHPSYAASCIAPCLERLELVSTGGAVGDGGNAWSGNRNRIVRTADGDIFTTVHAPGADPNDSNNRIWQLYKRIGDNNWQMLSSGPSGREPAHLLVGPQNELYIIAFINGYPKMWTSLDKGVSFTVEDIPNPGWYSPLYTSYSGAAITPNGDIYVSQSYGVDGNKPGEFIYSYRKYGSSTWAQKQQQFDFRDLYPYLLPLDADATGARQFSFTGNKVGSWADFGYASIPPAANGFNYVNKADRVWNTNDVDNQPLQGTVVKEVFPNAAVDNYIYTFHSDAYRDTNGLIHYLYHYKDESTGTTATSTGSFITRHAVIGKNNAVIKDVQLPFGDSGGIWGSNTARVFQDLSGTFWFLSTMFGPNSEFELVKSTTDDGTTLTGDHYVSLPLAPYQSANQAHFAVPRGGSSIENYIDGAIATENGTDWVYFRIRLNNNPDPTPTPTATPTPTLTPSPTPSPTPLPTATPSPTPTFTPTPTPTPITITFNDRPITTQSLNSSYPTSNINWGTNKWQTTGAWGKFTTQNLLFAQSLTQATISFTTPMKVISLKAYNNGPKATTVTLSCPGNSNSNTSLAKSTLTTVTTNWVFPCTLVTLQSSNGSNTHFDDIVLQ